MTRAADPDPRPRRALERLGADAAAAGVDGLADPAWLACELRALPDGDALLLRGVTPLARAAEGYGPDPDEPLWLRVRRGSAEIESARGSDGSARRSRAVRVERTSIDAPCCTDASCRLTKRRGSVAIVTDGAGDGNVVVAEALAIDDDALERMLRPVARRLAAVLGVPTDAEGDDGEPEASTKSGAVPAAVLARHCLRWEGTELVLRDHESLGPRDRARRLTLIGVLLVAVALPLWAAVAWVRSTWSLPATLGVAGVAAVVTLTAYAFLGVARFARKYVAASAPLVRLSSARITVMPWVSRSGAVDLRPEGRFGAAIPLNEVQKIAVVSRDGRHAIEVDTDHGPMDALATDDERVAQLWSAALERAIASAAHPQPKVSAKQRARQRADRPA